MVNLVQDYGYDYAFLLSSGVLLGGGIAIFFGLIPKPTDIGLPEPEDLEGEEEETQQPALRPRHGIEVLNIIRDRDGVCVRPSFDLFVIFFISIDR